jgi:hypothetical protein
MFEYDFGHARICTRGLSALKDEIGQGRFSAIEIF